MDLFFMFEKEAKKNHMERLQLEEEEEEEKDEKTLGANGKTVCVTFYFFFLSFVLSIHSSLTCSLSHSSFLHFIHTTPHTYNKVHAKTSNTIRLPTKHKQFFIAMKWPN